MNTRILRASAKCFILVILCCASRALAQAPVASNFSLATLAGVSSTVWLWKTNLLDGLGWLFYTNFQGLGGSADIVFTNNLPQAFFQIQAQ